MDSRDRPRNILIVSYDYHNEKVVGSVRPRVLSGVLQHEFNSVQIEIFKAATKSKLIWGLLLLKVLVSKKRYRVFVSFGPFWIIPWILISRLFRQSCLVADFRDVWSGHLEDCYPTPSPLQVLKIYLSRYLERKIYRASSEFWVCTPGMFQFYSRLFGDDTKIKLVLNGHNISPDLSTDFQKQEKLSKGSVIYLCCLGKFAEYDLAKAHRVVDLLEEFKRKNGMVELRLHLIGSAEEENLSFIQTRQAGDWIELLPRMDYLSALKHAARCDYGVCIIRNEAYDFGTKVFDYIGLGLPILDCFDQQSSFRGYFLPYIYPIQFPLPKLRIVKQGDIFRRENQFRKATLNWRAHDF